MGAALEQLTVDGWKPISFASRFLNSSEERYIINELELLGVVWSIEYFKNYLFGKEFTIITDHHALLSTLKEHRSNKSYNSRLSRWVDRLLPYQFSIEHLPGAKMGLVDYISRNPYQPAKSVSKYDEEFLFATLSSIHSDAQLLQQKHNILAPSLNKLYIDIDGENKNSTTNSEQVLNMDYVKSNPQTKINKPLALQNHSLIPFLNQNFNSDSDPAKRVRLTNYNSALVTQKYHSTLSSFNINNQHSEHASRVRLTQNITSLADQKYNSIFNPTNRFNCTSAHDRQVHSTQNESVFAHTYPTSKANTSKLINTNSDLASRVRFSFNKLTLARHNTLLNTQKIRLHSSDASFAKQIPKHQTHSNFASHSLPFTIKPLQIESQMLVETGKASLVYQKTPKFASISHSHLSIKNQSQIPTLFSNPNSNTLNNSRAQLTNNKQVLFAQTQPEIQLSSSLSIFNFQFSI